MLKYGVLATLLLASAFYFPIPGSDPCRALTTQYVTYLKNLGATSGFEILPVDELTREVVESVDRRFKYYPVRWGCAIEYWRNEVDPHRIDTQAREEFRQLLISKITLETGQEPFIAQDTLDELFLEYMQKIY